MANSTPRWELKVTAPSPETLTLFNDIEVRSRRNDEYLVLVGGRSQDDVLALMTVMDDVGIGVSRLIQLDCLSA